MGSEEQVVTVGENTDAVTIAPEQGQSGDLQKRFDKLAKWGRRITKANDLFKSLNQEVAERDSDVKAAKGRLAAAIEDRDAAGAELSKLVDDQKNGRDPLPGIEEQLEEPEQSGTSENWPISELGAKQLSVIVGESIMQASKDRDEPLGLTGPQLDKFESNGIATIGDLEKLMTDKPHDWWSFLAKKADAAIVNRVLNSWREFRMKNPVAERAPTIVESLAAQNEAAKASQPTILEAHGVDADALVAGASA